MRNEVKKKNEAKDIKLLKKKKKRKYGVSKSLYVMEIRTLNFVFV